MQSPFSCVMLITESGKPLLWMTAREQVHYSTCKMPNCQPGQFRCLYHKKLTTINWIIYTEAWPSSTLYALLTRRNGSTSPRFLSGCSFSAARRHARLRKHVGQRIGSLWNWHVPLLPDYYWSCCPLSLPLLAFSSTFTEYAVVGTWHLYHSFLASTTPLRFLRGIDSPCPARALSCCPHRKGPVLPFMLTAQGYATTCLKLWSGPP